VLDRIDITIYPSKITALMGPSGAGKTTLLRALSLVEPPDSGAVSINDIVYKYPLTQEVVPHPWPMVTVVFQDLFLWPHVTNGENILLGCRKRFGSKANKKVSQLADQLGFTGLLDRFPNQISRGQRQLIAIARALALEPAYLLLDEVSASLDLAKVSRVTDVLRDRARQGTGILSITHQIGFARHSADRFVYLDGGQIREDGDVTQIDSPKSSEFAAYLELVRRTL
jgi:ABC-type polar amino acid transport system ATPase subunit